MLMKTATGGMGMCFGLPGRTSNTTAPVPTIALFGSFCQSCVIRPACWTSWTSGASDDA